MRYLCLFPLLLLVPCVGCHRRASPPAAKAPRPVTVVTLEKQRPQSRRQVTGSVASWKTEQIGFEVAGRVKKVLEPGADVEGRVLDKNGDELIIGTVVATIDPERYQLAESAAAIQVEVAQLEKEAIQVTLDHKIPADVRAAEAELLLAQVERNRNQNLVDRNATAKADLDRAVAQHQTAEAKLDTLAAQEKQTNAALKSAEASIQQARQSLTEAKLNVRDTSLYSSFRGQVAEVHVVPGSVVAQGTPVATVQMMNPIKVEVELSAARSREIPLRGRLPVTVTMPDGTEESHDGFVYMIDPSADPATRTFTLTLLVLNKKIQKPLPPELEGKDFARSPDVWRMDFDFLPGAPEGSYYIEDKSIREDEKGHFVWKCLNAEAGSAIPEVLKVSKMRVTPENYIMPFLGNWTFQTVTVDPDQGFRPDRDVFVGLIEHPSFENPNAWNGDTVFRDAGGDWMLRPGDLVTVNLESEITKSGFYVPTEAIYEESQKHFVFVVVTSEGVSIAKRVPVTLGSDDNLQTGSLRLVSPTAETDLEEDMRLVVDGVHFLRDGEPVRIVHD